MTINNSLPPKQQVCADNMLVIIIIYDSLHIYAFNLDI